MKKKDKDLRYKVHVKKGDRVLILSGKDRSATGEVLAVYPSRHKVLVKDVNIATKHKKPNMRLQTGGIVHQENPIDSSNVMLICPKCKAPTKVKKSILENGEKVRVCGKCHETIDSISPAKE